MLIHLDGSTAADATSDSATAALSRACIENLLLAHFEGNHVVSLLPSAAEDVEMIHEVRGTGGSTFAPEYRKVADQGRIMLAIADSDRRHPKGGVGETCSKLEAV